jgi:hypothetical protein
MMMMMMMFRLLIGACSQLRKDNFSVAYFRVKYYIIIIIIIIMFT